MANKKQVTVEELAQAGYRVPARWAEFGKNSEETQLAASTDRDENGRPLPAEGTQPAIQPEDMTEAQKAGAPVVENKAARKSSK